MTESYIIPEFDENGNFLSDDVKARIVEMIEAHAPTPVLSNPGPEVITLEEGHPNLAGSLAEPLPDDLPVGSYLVNEPRFMGYRLSQKTPFGWDLKDFEATVRYNVIPGEGDLRWVIKRGSTPIEGASLTGTVTATADSLRISVNISGANFTKGELVTVGLEGPNYSILNGYTAVSHHFHDTGSNAEGYLSYVQAVPGGFSLEGEYISGLNVKVLVGRAQNTLSFYATLDLGTPPDMRAYDRTYVPPSERVEVEVPEPTVVEADDHMSSTVTIPEVEGVTWNASFRYAQAGTSSAEPGVYEVTMAEAQSFTISAEAEKGYYITNNDGTKVPWKTTAQWSYSQGLPLTAPMPEPLNATTEGGVNGWIVRFPEVEHARYYIATGWSPTGPVKKVMTGDAFTPNSTWINAEADPPYYVTKPSLGSLKADGTIN